MLLPKDEDDGAHTIPPLLLAWLVLLLMALTPALLLLGLVPPPPPTPTPTTTPLPTTPPTRKVLPARLMLLLSLVGTVARDGFCSVGADSLRRSACLPEAKPCATATARPSGAMRSVVAVVPG